MLPIPVRVKVVDQDQEFKLTTLGDISWGGVFVMMNPPAPLGSRIILQFLVLDEHVLLELWGTVVRSKPDSPEEPAGVGVEFDQLDEDSRSLIQRLVDDEVIMLVKNA
jgi:uncharacterized protein (TIGR02266 family)